MLADETRTLLLPVTLAEELPVRETVQLVTRARDELSIHLDVVVVNGIHSHPFPGQPHLVERLDQLSPDLAFEGLPAPKTLARCARHALARHVLNEMHVEALAADVGLPMLRLPYLPDGVNGPLDLETLAQALLGGAGSV